MTLPAARNTLLRRHRCGISLIEANIALALAAVAGAAVLLSVETTVDSSRKTSDELVATGLASQMADEVLGKRYKAIGVTPYQTPLSAAGYEQNSANGQPLYYAYDDIDDFVSHWSMPPRDGWGINRGSGDGVGGERHANFRVANNFFDGWIWFVKVNYADENDQSIDLTSGTSNYRAVTVLVYKQHDSTYQLIARERRVVAYVPTTP